MTDRVSPALDAEAVSVYVPLAVGGPPLSPPPVVAGGILLPLPHPEAKTRQATAITLNNHHRRARDLQKNIPSGSATTKIPRPISSSRQRGSPEVIEAVETPVWTVTEIVAVPPRGALDGCTTHVELAGAPAHDNTAIPGTPASEESNNGYTAEAPLLTVTLVLPFALNVKSTPVPPNEIVCGELAALSCTLNEPVRPPATVGVKTTCTMHAFPTPRVVPQLFPPVAMPKSPATATPSMVSTALPLLVNVTVCGVEARPTPIAPNVSALAGDKDTPAGATPMPFSVTT